MDRGAWWAAVHGVTESQTGLSTCKTGTPPPFSSGPLSAPDLCFVLPGPLLLLQQPMGSLCPAALHQEPSPLRTGPASTLNL